MTVLWTVRAVPDRARRRDRIPSSPPKNQFAPKGGLIFLTEKMSKQKPCANCGKGKMTGLSKEIRLTQKLTSFAKAICRFALGQNMGSESLPLRQTKQSLTVVFGSVFLL